MMAQMMMVLGAPSERPDTLGLEQVQLLCILTTSVCSLVTLVICCKNMDDPSLLDVIY